MIDQALVLLLLFASLSVIILIVNLSALERKFLFSPDQQKTKYYYFHRQFRIHAKLASADKKLTAPCLLVLNIWLESETRNQTKRNLNTQTSQPNPRIL